MQVRLLQSSVQMFLLLVLGAISEVGLTQTAQTFVESRSSPELNSHLQLQAQAEALPLEKVASFAGEFRGFTPDGQGMVTYSKSDEQIRIFDLDGTEELALTGRVVNFAPDGQIMAITAFPEASDSSNQEPTTSLVKLDGTELANFQGYLPEFTAEEQTLIVYDNAEDVSRLFSFSGEELVTFEGWFYEFTPEGEGAVTYSEAEQGFLISDLNGTRLLSFPGDHEGWQITPDGQRIVTTVFSSEGDRTWLFDRNGVEQATFAGCCANVMPDSEALILYFKATATSRLMSFEGEELASFTGYYRTFTPDGQQIIMLGNNETYIYALDGTEIAVLSGAFERFLPDGQGIITSFRENSVTRLYSLDGVELATYEGAFADFWPEEQAIITYSYQEDETRLFSPEGADLGKLPGMFVAIPFRYEGISPDGTGIVVYSNTHDRSDLYSIR